MERIRPPSHQMPLMREGLLDGGAATCELGVYGVILSDGKRVLANRSAGHLLRVKLEGVDEGGVCAGFAVLSSPVLYY
jgi:glutathione synthase